MGLSVIADWRLREAGEKFVNISNALNSAKGLSVSVRESFSKMENVSGLMVVGKFTLFRSIYPSHHNIDTGQTHDMRRDGKMGSVY
jgi:hypothetical protein